MQQTDSEGSEADFGAWTPLRVLDGWEPWHVAVRVATMPDGSPAISGIQMIPRDDFDGSLSEQRLTAERLRRLPMRRILAEGLAEQARARNADGDTVEVLDAKARVAALLDDNRLRRITRAEEVGTEQERLEWASHIYRLAVALGEPPRPTVAKALGVSVRTVDRLLAESRKRGLLEAYQGGQGKYGKDHEQE